MGETTTRATVDRIVDGERAVLLLEGEMGEREEVVVCAGALPAPGRREGAVFEVARDGGDVVDLTFLPEETTRRQADAQDRLDRLSSPLGEATEDEE